jgi:hypothetical protein
MAEKKYIDPYKAFYGATVPNWLMERPEVSTGAKLCYARLCQFYGTDRKCERTQKEIAEKLATGERQTRRYLDELTKHGLIEEDKIGYGGCHRYRFLDHPWVDFRADSSMRTETTGLTVNADISGHIDRTDMATLSIEKKNKKKGGEPIEIPAPLQGESFAAAWGEFIKHRSEIKKPLTPLAIRKQLKALEKIGPARAVAAIDHSIANGWTGIYEPKDGAGNVVQQPPIKGTHSW